MKKVDNEELEYFIQDWHWDRKSHKFAQQTGNFLFQFIDALEKQGLSERTIRKHTDNCWSIGILECQYGYHENFSPNIFICEEASYLFVRKRPIYMSLKESTVIPNMLLIHTRQLGEN